MMLDMDSTLPLSALLSQVLVTFTIEFDNKAEHRLLHRTSKSRRNHRLAACPMARLHGDVVQLHAVRYG
jgi:hypothetical protein